MISKSQITFLGCATKLSYGIVGLQNGKVKSFERETDFNAVISKKKKICRICIFWNFYN